MQKFVKLNKKLDGEYICPNCRFSTRLTTSCPFCGAIFTNYESLLTLEVLEEWSDSMPKNLEELAKLISDRDGITLNEARLAVNQAQIDMESAFYSGSLDRAEMILAQDLGLEPDYLMLFIN